MALDPLLFVTAFFTSFSVVSGAYVVWSTARFSRMLRRYRPRSLEQCRFLITSLRWMSICDIIFESLDGYVAVSDLIQLEHNKSSSQQFYGIDSDSVVGVLLSNLFTSFGFASVSWSFIIALSLLRLLIFKTDLDTLNAQVKWYHLFVWVSAGMMFVGRVVFWYVTQETQSYGYSYRSKELTLSLYVPVSLYIMFAFILLLYITYIRICVAVFSNLAQRLVYFTVVFVVNWGFITFAGFYMAYVGNLPTVLYWICTLCVASVGAGNALVWATSAFWTKSSLLLKPGIGDTAMSDTYERPSFISSRRTTSGTDFVE